MRIMGLSELMIVLIGFIVVRSIVIGLPWFFIYKKAGFHPALGCLMFLPLVNEAMTYVLAFSEWPIERELRNQRVPPAQTY